MQHCDWSSDVCSSDLEEDEEDTEEASGIAENNSIDLGDVVVHLDDYDK